MGFISKTHCHKKGFNLCWSIGEPLLISLLHNKLFFFYMTIQVNEAEAQKEESWLTHQKMYKAYQDVEKKAREMQSKLRNTIQKAR